MRLTSVKIFDYYPLWKKWEIDRYEPSHTISLLVGLFGLISSFWTMTIWFTSSFNQSMREFLVLEDQYITIYLSNFGISLIISFPIGIITLMIMMQVNDDLSATTVKSQWKEFKKMVFETVSLNFVEEIDNDLSDEKKIARATRNYLVVYISVTFILGFAAGTFYSLIYYIPYYMINILFAFIVSIFFGINLALPFAMLLSWALFIWWIIKRKLYKEISPKKEIDYQQDFQYSNRTYEILASKKEAIICPSCRSYISANSINCRVCGDKIKED